MRYTVFTVFLLLLPIACSDRPVVHPPVADTTAAPPDTTEHGDRDKGEHGKKPKPHDDKEHQ